MKIDKLKYQNNRLLLVYLSYMVSAQFQDQDFTL